MSKPSEKLEAIFEAAVALETEAQRADYLNRACPDLEVRRDVQSLLAAHLNPDSVFAEKTIRVEPAPSEAVGTMIGRYKLLEKLGEGGFGAVWAAEQKEPVRRRVALKIIKLGMDTQQVVARFEAERQALALMDHPNIARVLDAGATDAGRPYFVMELVRGNSITKFCDENKLATRERLELFMKVCHAVQHAHQKGIIHRDLKPSNVLVTLHDGVPVPKVIDFGIAKATQAELTEKTIYTQHQQFIGTPAYVSPEQAEMSGLDLDTRSDIYSLGVLLYELLTGATPFNAQALLKSGLDEMRRIIREEEPKRPSTRLSTLEQVEATTLAKHRQEKLPALVNLVRGDLDWITMKCLEKDRTRRYETANGLAMDLKRHLNNEPVVARPPSASYRFQKLARRHRVALATGCAFALVCVAGFVGVLWQWRRADFNARAEASQRQRAEANFRDAREAIDRMFIRVADELADQPRMEHIRRKLLEDALQFYERFLQQKGDDPSVRQGAALAYLRVGNIYDKLGQHDKGVAPLEQGVAMMEDLARRQLLTPLDREEMASAHARLAFAHYWLDPDTARALAHRQKVLALYQALRRDFPTEPKYPRLAASAHVDVGNVLKAANRPTEAIAEFQQALTLSEQLRRDFPDQSESRTLVAHTHHWFGATLEYAGRWEEAEREYRAAHDLRVQMVAEQPGHAWLQNTLAHVRTYLVELLMKVGRLSEAQELARLAVAQHEEILRNYPDLGDYRRCAGGGFESFGKVQAALGQTREAEAALRRSVAIREKLVADIPNVPVHGDDLAGSYYNLGLCLAEAGRAEEAAAFFRKALALWEQLVTPSPRTRACERHLAWMLATCPATEFRDPPRALTLAKKSMQHEGETARHWSLLGLAQYRAGDYAAAIESLHKSIDLANGGDAQQWLFLAMSLQQQGDHAQAREWYDKAVAWIEKIHPGEESYVRFRIEAAKLLGVPAWDDGIHGGRTLPN